MLKWKTSKIGWENWEYIYICRNVTIMIDDGRPRPTSSNHVCCSRVLVPCHTRRSPTVCAAQGPSGHATLHVIQSCVLSKADDSMPCPTPSDCVCFLRAMIECHAWRRLIMYALLGRWWHLKSDVIRPCVHSKGDDGIATDDVVQPCVLPKGHDVIPRPT